MEKNKTYTVGVRTGLDGHPHLHMTLAYLGGMQSETIGRRSKSVDKIGENRQCVSTVRNIWYIGHVWPQARYSCATVSRSRHCT